MTVTDIHAHILVPDCLEEMRRISPEGVPTMAEESEGTYLIYRNGARNGPLPPGMVDVTRRMADMEYMGVDLQVVSVRPQLFHYGLPSHVAARLASVQNDAVTTVAHENHDRINAFITLPMQDVSAAVAEVERLAGDPLVRGVLVDSHISGHNLDEPSFEPVWSILEERDLPIFIHPYQADVVGIDRLQRYYLFNLIGNPADSTIAVASLVFGGILDRHPLLRVAVAHGGGLTPFLTGRWDRGYICREEARVATDQTPSAHVDRLWFDSVVHNSRVLSFLGDFAGWDRVLIGSDYPFDMGDPQPLRTLWNTSISKDDYETVTEYNSEPFLRPLPDNGLPRSV